MTKLKMICCPSCYDKLVNDSVITMLKLEPALFPHHSSPSNLVQLWVHLQCPLIHPTPPPNYVSQNLNFSMDEIHRNLTSNATNYFHDLYDSLSSPPQRDGFIQNQDTTDFKILQPWIYWNLSRRRTHMSKMVMK